MYGYGVEVSFTTDGGYTFPTRVSRESAFPTVTTERPAFPRRITRERPTVASTAALPSVAGLVVESPLLPSFERPPAVTASEARFPDMSPPASGGTRAYPTPTRDTGIMGWFRGLFAPRPVYPAPRYYYPAPRYYYPRAGYPLVGAGDLFASGVFSPGAADAARAGAGEDAAVEAAALAPPATKTPWLLYAGVGLAVAGGVYLWRKKQKKG